MLINNYLWQQTDYKMNHNAFLNL